MNITKIRSKLSLAATTLLGACGSDSGGGGPAAEVNTAAPNLVGTWQSACIALPSPKPLPGTSVTMAAPSGGGGGGGGSLGGDTRRDTISFTQGGTAEFISEYYASNNCNTNTALPASWLESFYYVGGITQERNGSDVVEVDYQDSSGRVYSIFQLVSGTELYLGDLDSSSSNKDGSSEANRFDGLGARLLRQ